MSRKRKHLCDSRDVAVANLAVNLKAADSTSASPSDLRVCCGERVEFNLSADAGDGKKSKSFAMTAYTGEPMNPSGWYKSTPIVVDLEGMNVPRQSLPVDVEHQASDIAGHTLTIEKTPQRLKCSGVLSGWDGEEDDAPAKASRMVARLAAGGFPWQASMDFTASIPRLEFVDAGASVNVNGKRINGPVYVARQSTLKRISFVANGADGNTSASIAASQGVNMNPFDQWCQAKNIDAAAFTGLVEPVKVALKASFDAEQAVKAKAAAPPEKKDADGHRPFDASADAELRAKSQREWDQLEQQRLQAMAADIERMADINRICAAHPGLEIEIEKDGKKSNVVLHAHAIKEKWTAKETEMQQKLTVLERDRVQPREFFGYATAGNQAPTGEVLEAAFCASLNVRDYEKAYTPQTLEMAGRNFKNFGLQQMILMAAAQNGYRVSPGERISNGNIRSIFQHAFAPLHLRAASTLSLPGILGNVANKVLLAGYMEEDQNWREIARVVSRPNFYAATYYRLLDSMVYEQLGPSGEIKHGSLGQESYTSQAKTYAKMFALKREEVINDDLGAFDDLRARLGRGAARGFNNIFWAAFINNSSFFTSARTNYISGATTNLGTDGVGLGLAVKAFRLMTSPAADGSKKVGSAGDNGSRIGLRPEIMVVPPELEANAELTYRNQNLDMVSNATANIYANKYRPVVAWQLSDSSFTGYSTTAWYLLANPTIAAPVIVSFLNGQQQPTIESAEADFNVLGIQFRGFFDFGCDQAEYLAGVKSKGAA